MQNNQSAPLSDGRQGHSVLASLRLLVPQREASFLEALRVAEQQSQRFLHRLGVSAGPVSEELLLELPRIAIEYVYGMPTSGCSFWDVERRSWIVQINASEPATRQRFTIFHEYKHIVDHGLTAQLYGSGPEASLHAEQAADFFAGCVLMPRPFVKRLWGSGVQTAGTLAAQLDVSTVAAQVRIAQIGLADVPPRCAPQMARSRSERSRRLGQYQRQLSQGSKLEHAVTGRTS